MVMEGGCVRDFEECNCECHRIEGIMHVVACCWRCHKCGMNIAVSREMHECEVQAMNTDTIPGLP